MKKFSALLLLALCAAPHAHAQSNKPIFLNRVESERFDKCKQKVYVEMGGVRYGLHRIPGMDYTLPDGTIVTDKDPQHPLKHCNVTELGEVTAFTTGFMRSGLSVRAELVPADKKDSFLSTYADRKDAIQQNMNERKIEFLEDKTIKTKFKTSVVYLLPKEVSKTGNGQRIAIYCTLPAHVDIEKNKEAEMAGEKEKVARRSCTTRYLHPNGLGFGYSFIDGTEDKHVLIDLTARKILEKLAVEKPAESRTNP